jgi:hypothetical protein
MSDRTLTYFEHYPHYYVGTLNAEGRISETALAFMLTLIASKDDEDIEEFMAELEDDPNNNLGYAFLELLQGNTSAEITNALNTTGTFGASWEEGSHAISYSLADAKAAVRKIELEFIDLD